MLQVALQAGHLRLRLLELAAQLAAAVHRLLHGLGCSVQLQLEGVLLCLQLPLQGLPGGLGLLQLCPQLVQLLSMLRCCRGQLLPQLLQLLRVLSSGISKLLPQLGQLLPLLLLLAAALRRRLQCLASRCHQLLRAGMAWAS